jgi:hypothetical protein
MERQIADIVRMLESEAPPDVQNAIVRVNTDLSLHVQVIR